MIEQLEQVSVNSSANKLHHIAFVEHQHYTKKYLTDTPAALKA